MPIKAPRPAPRLLITAGPTQEPIDAVRYLGNRSSGRLGVALARAGAERGWRVKLLLGPTPRRPEHSSVDVHRFRTTAELQALLAVHTPECDALIMAAAVADYRPVIRDSSGQPATIDPATQKLRRSADRLTLDLESTPDLLAERAAARLPGQLFVGFALEPRDHLIESARAKLERKGVDMIVANPLETMDAETIEAHVLSRDGATTSTTGAIDKDRFATWLLDQLETRLTQNPSGALSLGRGLG